MPQDSPNLHLQLGKYFGMNPVGRGIARRHLITVNPLYYPVHDFFDSTRTIPKLLAKILYEKRL